MLVELGRPHWTNLRTKYVFEMFHPLKIFTQRFVSLLAYVWDYKIILVSVLHLFFILFGISLLRNNWRALTIGLFYMLGCVLLTIAIALCISKREKDKSFVARDDRGRGERVRQAMSIFILSFCVATFGLVCSLRVVNKEKIVSNTETSFTSSYTKLNGIVVSEPAQKHSYQNLEVRPLRGSDTELEILGNILIKVEKFQKFRVGDVCKISGTLVEPKNSENFDYKKFLKNREIYFLMEYPKIECKSVSKKYILRRSLVDLKQKIVKSVEKYLNEPQSSLFVGILMGENRLFSESFGSYVRIAGISHIVAASGYNVTILLIVLNSFLKFLPKKLRIGISLAIIWCFCLLSGVSASIVRACIMASISLIGLFWGRRGSIHVVFFLCIFIFILFDPKIVFDVGFQLSCCATGGLIYLLPSIINALKIVSKEGFFVDTVLTTISCTITTLPVSIFTFQTFSMWSVIANTLVLPIIETTLLFGVGGLLLSSPFLMSIVNLQLKYVEIVVQLIGSSGFGYWDLVDGRVISICIAIFIVLFCIYFYPVGDEDSNYYLKIYS